MPTDLSEYGLETLIVTQMTGITPQGESLPEDGAMRWLPGNASDYDRSWCIDTQQLTTFLQQTQPEVAEHYRLDTDNPSRTKLLARIHREIDARGVIDVLRKGVKEGPHHVSLMYGTPSELNVQAQERFRLNRFSVTRQLRYSAQEQQRALDLAIFVNGLPVATFELKNRITKQTVDDAVRQYKNDRDPREPLFRFGRCMVHFAVDDSEVKMCTHLKGEASWFLPFNKGHNQGGGNPVNPKGLKTDYLWREVLEPRSLTNIIEHYAQILEETDPETGKKRSKQIFPRYHQLDVVKALLRNVQNDGVGHRYLIQHSAGSGKSNSIAWLALQLVGLRKDGGDIFDSVIVITDRRVLDKQIKNTIKGFAQVGATVGHAERSSDLKEYIHQSKKIIITTVQKFPFVMDEIGQLQGRHYAIIIDEAHSGQGGKTSAAMNKTLAGDALLAEDDPEEFINQQLEARIQSRKLLTNASYFAFTATPKNKTLELFGEELPQPEGKIGHVPCHLYSMKQAIDEGYIMDVLSHYTPVDSYYKLMRKVEGEDPEMDRKRAMKKLRKYVEQHETAIRSKAEIMVDHFQERVIATRKIGGQARAMVICDNIEVTIKYFFAIRDYLKAMKSPYLAIVAFTGEKELDGEKHTESSLNGFPSEEITKRIKKDPYRFLICADKFQTGYDEPLLHTMYVDKHLSGVQAVQTLSRLNRAHPQKRDVFILDFKNNEETIHQAFEAYYTTTILSDKTDPNKLHDLKRDLDKAGVYTPEQVVTFAERFLQGESVDQLHPLLDDCVQVYLAELDEDGQVDFKSRAKAFVRTYDFLSAILPYSMHDWEQLSIFLYALLPKLPTPMEEDTTRGLLQMVDMDSYRAEKKAEKSLALSDDDAFIDPVQSGGGAMTNPPDIDRLSNIIREFNEQFGRLFEDADRVAHLIAEDIAPRVAADPAFQNAQKNTPNMASLEMENALGRVMLTLLKDDTELYRQFVENESFRGFVREMVRALVAA